MRKKIAIGCGVAVVLFVIVRVGPRVFQWAQHQIAEEQERQRLAADWQPPAKDAGPDTLFPTKVHDFQRVSHDDKAAILDFKLDIPGHHAAYRSGHNQVDVFVYQVNEQEKENLFGRIEDAYRASEGAGTRRLTKMGYRCYYSSPKHYQNHFWWVKGWLLGFRTRDEEDREPFVKAFLKATSAQAQSGQPK